MDKEQIKKMASGFDDIGLMVKIKALTETIDVIFQNHNGIKMKFALVVFSENQAMMTGNGEQESILEALEHVIKAHREGAERVTATDEELNEMIEANEKPKH